LDGLNQIGNGGDERAPGVAQVLGRRAPACLPYRLPLPSAPTVCAVRARFRRR
jgi:hypothetical protein